MSFAYHDGFVLIWEPVGDLPSFYYAAQTAFVHGQSPYPPHALSWGTHALNQKVWPFLYPPPTLLLFSPFAHMSYKAAKLLVLASSHLFILLLLFLLLHLLGLGGLLRRRAPAQTDEPGGSSHQEYFALFLLTYFFAFEPMVSTLLSGQINFYVIVFLCLTWIGLKRNAAPGLIALPLILAIVFKTYPLLLLPILLAQGRWQVVLWTLGGLALLAGGSILVLPHVVWHDWLTFVLPYGAYSKAPLGLFPVSSDWNQNINGFTARLFLDPHTAIVVSRTAARVVPTILAAGFIGAEMVLSRRLWHAGRAQGSDSGRQIDWEFSLFLLTMFLVAPLSWEHHLVFVLPAICVALKQVSLTGERRGVALWVAGAAFVIAWQFPLDAPLFNRHLFHLLLSLKFYAVVALWMYFAAYLWRSGHAAALKHLAAAKERALRGMLQASE